MQFINKIIVLKILFNTGRHGVGHLRLCYTIRGRSNTLLHLNGRGGGVFLSLKSILIKIVF